MTTRKRKRAAPDLRRAVAERARKRAAPDLRRAVRKLGIHDAAVILCDLAEAEGFDLRALVHGHTTSEEDYEDA